MKGLFIDMLTFLFFRKGIMSAWRRERKAYFMRMLLLVAATIAAVCAAVVSGTLFFRRTMGERELRKKRKMEEIGRRENTVGDELLPF